MSPSKNKNWKHCGLELICHLRCNKSKKVNSEPQTILVHTGYLCMYKEQIWLFEKVIERIRM